MTFDEFWTLYPKKVARRDAEKAWLRLSMFDRDAVSDVLASHVEIWRRRERKFIPHAGTWLRARRWEDDITDDIQSSNHQFFRTHGYHRSSV